MKLAIVFISSLVATLSWAGAPSAVPYRERVDLPDDATRQILVTSQDRGPVWCLTGFLDGWNPDTPIDTIRTLHPHHWRNGQWPFWHPRDITLARPQPRWNDRRDTATYWSGQLDAILTLRPNGLTNQVIVSDIGPYYGMRRFEAEDLKGWNEHLRIVLAYARHMGLPIDYLEVWNEPSVGPYEGIAPDGYWRGTWDEYLAMWDTAYNAIRAVWPEAKIVGPSYPKCTAATIEPFLAHCAKRGQKLDVLSWHEITQQEIVVGPEYKGEAVVEPDKTHKNITQIRALVDTSYPKLGVKEIHIDEWGFTIARTGPGTQMAYFYYLDQAGVDRAARSHWTEEDLDGLLYAPPDCPRTSYWCWVEYAKQDGSARLVTETNDRNVIALASRNDQTHATRVLLARAKRDTGDQFAMTRPPVAVDLAIEGIPLDEADVTILKLGPDEGPLKADQLPRKTSYYGKKPVKSQKLDLHLKDLEENQVYSIVIAPVGTHAAEREAAQRHAKTLAASRLAKEGKTLPRMLFKEDFEKGFQDSQTVLGVDGWMHARNKTCNQVASHTKLAHGGRWCARFDGAYWSDHDVYHSIDVRADELVEVTAWFRFPEYDGNKNGHGLGGMMLGLYEAPDGEVDCNFASFRFGTNGQTDSSGVMFNNNGTRSISYKQPSTLSTNVYGRWYQVGLVLDAASKTITCRYRATVEQPWQLFYEGKLKAMDWMPKFVGISAFNQPPDWRFHVDDIEVRTGE